MKWIKKKKLFDLVKTNQLIQSNASNPVPLHLEGVIFKVFFSFRNVFNLNLFSENFATSYRPSISHLAKHCDTMIPLATFVA